MSRDQLSEGSRPSGRYLRILPDLGTGSKLVSRKPDIPTSKIRKRIHSHETVHLIC